MSKACDSQESLGVERRVDPALGGVGVRAHRVDLGDDPDRDALPRRRRARRAARRGRRRSRVRRAGMGDPMRPIAIRSALADGTSCREGVAQRATDLVGGDHARAAARRRRPRPGRRGGAGPRCRAATRAARRRGPCSVPLGVELEHLADRCAARLGSGTPSAASRTSRPRKRSRGVDDREPGPAVAQEVLVERALDARAPRGSRPARRPSRRRRVMPSIRLENSDCTDDPRAD